MLLFRRLVSASHPSSSSQSYLSIPPLLPSTSASSRGRLASAITASTTANKRFTGLATPASLSAGADSSASSAAAPPPPSLRRPIPRHFGLPAAARGGCVHGYIHSLLRRPNRTRFFLRQRAAFARFCTLGSIAVVSRAAARRVATSSGAVSIKLGISTFGTTGIARAALASSLHTSHKYEIGNSIKATDMAAHGSSGVAAASSAGSPVSAAAAPRGPSKPGISNSGGTVSRRFAPLDPAKARRLVGQENLRWVRGVVFDVDGTLCQPQNYMFAEMRAALSIPPQIDILEHIYSLPPPQQSHAFAAIRSIERRAMAVQQPQPGLVPLMDYLESRMLRKAICTRNFDAPVLHLLEKFLPGHSFDPIVTRDFRPPKPHPAGILSIAKAWGCLDGPIGAAGIPPLGEGQAVAPPPIAPLTPPDMSYAGSPASSAAGGLGGFEGEVPVIAGSAPCLIMVGDSLDDMVAGRLAGAATVLLLNESNVHLARREETDLVIRRLDDLIVVLENGFVGQHGT